MIIENPIIKEIKKVNAKCRVWLNRPLTDAELLEYEIDKDNY